MTHPTILVVAIGIAGLFLNCAALFIGYGVLRGTVDGLAQRVAALEGEIGSFVTLQVRVAEIGARQEAWRDQLKDLRGSLRRLHEPSPAGVACALGPIERA